MLYAQVVLFAFTDRHSKSANGLIPQFRGVVTPRCLSRYLISVIHGQAPLVFRSWPEYLRSNSSIFDPTRIYLPK